MLPYPNVPRSLTPPQSPATSPFAVRLLVPPSHYDAVGLRLSIQRGAMSHPLEAPGLAWRTEEAANV